LIRGVNGIQGVATATGGTHPGHIRPDRYAHAHRELDRWDKVIKAINFKLDPE